MRQRSAGQLVVLRLGDGEYGLVAGAVEQVVRMVAIRPVPEAPPWIAGVVNLRGRTTPMTDLRTRLGLHAGTHGLSDHIVIVRSRKATRVLLPGADALNLDPRFEDWLVQTAPRN